MENSAPENSALRFRAIDDTFIGCFLSLTDAPEQLIATMLGVATLNIRLREQFITLCQTIVDDMCDEANMPRYQWNKTKYV